MRVNPGGRIAPDDVIGCDSLIESLWRSLERQSVVLAAPRRIGKTTICQKMVSTSRPQFAPVYHELEGIRTPGEFVETVYHDVDQFLSGKRKAAKLTGGFLQQIRGTKAGGIELPAIAATHWKTLLEKAVADLSEHSEQTILFFWDEMPMMLENIRQDIGEKAAMELLDVLRALRQTYPHLRMVYTGSVGLHHIVGSLKRSGYTNSPLNDMDIVDVPPLSTQDATRLAFLLLEGENVVSPDNQALAAQIASAVDNVPFYIQYVVDRIASHSETINNATVAKVVRALLLDAQNVWDMRHYRERISTYYLGHEQKIALATLDIVAGQPIAPSQRQLLNMVSLQIADLDMELARNVFTSLQRDHYLHRNESDETYRFYQPLIRQWWRIERGL